MSSGQKRRMVWLVELTTGVSQQALASGYVESGINMLLNPDFLAGATTSWTAANSATLAAAANEMSITAPGAVASVMAYQAVYLEAGKRYRASVRYRVEDATAIFGFLDDTGSSVATTTGLDATDSALVEQEYTAAASGTYRVALYHSGTSDEGWAVYGGKFRCYEIAAAQNFNPSDYATRTHRWASTPGFQVSPLDDPTCPVYEPRVIDPGNTEAHLFAKGTTLGRSVFARGDIILNNADKALDRLAAEIVDDGILTVRYGPTDGSYPADFPVVQTGICRAMPRYENLKCVLSWTDMQSVVFDRLASTARFGGTNVGAAGVDGTTNDLADKIVPEIWGNPGKRVPAVMVNAKSLMLQVSRREVASIADVQDKGALLPIDDTLGTLALLQAATVSAGHCQIYLGDNATGEGAYIKLGSEPAGQVTCTALEGATPALRTLAQVISRILAGPGGVASGAINPASVAQLDAADSAETGIWIGPDDTDKTVGDLLEFLLDGTGAWLIADDDQKWYLGVLGRVAGEPQKLFTKANIGKSGFDIQFNVDTGGIPASAVIVNYAYNYLVSKPEDMIPPSAGDTAAMQNILFAGAAYRSLRIPPRANQPIHPTAKPMTINTRLPSTADANRRGLRARDFYCEARMLVTLPVPVSEAVGVRRGSLVTVQVDRFAATGLPDGLDFMVIGEVHERGGSNPRVYFYAVEAD